MKKLLASLAVFGVLAGCETHQTNTSHSLLGCESLIQTNPSASLCTKFPQSALYAVVKKGEHGLGVQVYRQQNQQWSVVHFYDFKVKQIHAIKANPKYSQGRDMLEVHFLPETDFMGDMIHDQGKFTFELLQSP